MANFNDEYLEKCLKFCLDQKRIAYTLSEFQKELDKSKSALIVDSFNNARSLFKMSNFEEIVINIQVCKNSIFLFKARFQFK